MAASPDVKREYPDRPLVGVGVLIWRGPAEGGEVLLIRRARPPRQGQLSIPGGLQELGETVFEAARREVAEETSLRVEPIRIVDVVDFIEPGDGGRPRYHYTLVDVLAEWRAGEPRPSDEVASAEWVTLETLPVAELWEETVRVVRLSAEMRAKT